MTKLDINPNKILLIQQRQLGDVLLATHTLAKLQERFPHAQIDFLTEKKCEQILQNNPNITNTYYYNKKEQSNIFKQIAFYKKLAKNNYDLLISLQNLPRCLLTAFFSKAKHKIGLENVYFYNKFYSQKKHKSTKTIALENLFYSKLFYTQMIKPTSHFSGAKKLHVLEPFGIEAYEEAQPYWYFKEEERIEAKKVLLENNLKNDDLLITMDVTTNKHSRRYPKEYYAQIIHAIQNKFSNAKFLFLRSESEESEVAEYIELLKNKSSIILPKPCPSIRISAALMAEAKYHIGNCSFPRHLAVGLDIPSTILIGAGESIWDYPSEKFFRFHALVKEIPNNAEYLERNDFIWLSPDKIMPEILEHIEKFTQ